QLRALLQVCGVAALVAQAGCERRAAARVGDAPGGPRSDAPIDSKPATWTCTSSPCPWGASLTNHVVAWPASVQPVAARLGYTTSPPVYAPASSVNGATLAIASGKASVHAGKSSELSHRLLATVSAGQRYQISGLAADDVLSVQSDAGFGYRLTLPEHPAAPAPAPAPAPTPTPAPAPARGPEPPPGAVIHARRALWRCKNTPGCFSDPWPGAAIPWPAWAAHQSNGRSGNVLRFVFATDGTPLYPYMGPWAEGCEVTAESGAVTVVEWQRGASEWRHTDLRPRESHVIHLVPPEDGALIEAQEGTFEFSVSLRNCTPKPLPPPPDAGQPRGKPGEPMTPR
ncbi:MAG TPA: hypothetical protein VGD37_02930, partial [Kofleriaceae bacterium]